MSRNKYCPDYLVTPGEVLKEHLEHAGLTQTELAEREIAGQGRRSAAGVLQAEGFHGYDRGLCDVGGKNGRFN